MQIKRKIVEEYDGMENLKCDIFSDSVNKLYCEFNFPHETLEHKKRESYDDIGSFQITDPIKSAMLISTGTKKGKVLYYWFKDKTKCIISQHMTKDTLGKIIDEWKNIKCI